ncbi:MAG: hypothetical protein JXQ74_02255 [Alphaproteobacteria bacterium]|nr:hypothetical protein [Alphaproteobacteria bacterium]
MAAEAYGITEGGEEMTAPVEKIAKSGKALIHWSERPKSIKKLKIFLKIGNTTIPDLTVQDTESVFPDKTCEPID